jgi:hypothetical protein
MVATAGTRPTASAPKKVARHATWAAPWLPEDVDLAVDRLAGETPTLQGQDERPPAGLSAEGPTPARTRASINPPGEITMPTTKSTATPEPVSTDQVAPATARRRGASLNRVTLVCRLAADPELRYSFVGDGGGLAPGRG